MSRGPECRLTGAGAGESSRPLLVARGLRVGYGQGSGSRVLLGPVDLEVPTRRLVGLLGSNGSGKSTLLRTLAAMQPPLSGGVELTGCPLDSLSGRERARRIGVVLTERVRVGSMTVRELVALGRLPHVGWAGRLGSGDRAAVERALELGDVGDLAERPVHDLSDGERQRVMIARALAQEAELLLLDEPTAFLDPPRRLEVLSTLRSLVDRQGLAVVVASHDLEALLPFVDRVWLLAPGPSAVADLVVGGPEDLALAGAFERAFARTGQRWDVERGTFLPIRELRGRAAVEASGARRRWAERALERAGFDSEDRAAGSVSLRLVEQGEGWRLERGGTTVELPDLASVVETLRPSSGEPGGRPT